MSEDVKATLQNWGNVALKWSLTALASLVCWICLQIWGDVKELKTSNYQTKIKLVNLEHLRERQTELRLRLAKIEDSLRNFPK